jgi:hypothetical protein
MPFVPKWEQQEKVVARQNKIKSSKDLKMLAKVTH